MCSLYLTLCDPMDCSPPGFSVHGIIQARILVWVAISFSKVSSGPRDRTCISCIFCTSRWILYYCDMWEAPRKWQEYPRSSTQAICPLSSRASCLLPSSPPGFLGYKKDDFTTWPLTISPFFFSTSVLAFYALLDCTRLVVRVQNESLGPDSAIAYQQGLSEPQFPVAPSHRTMVRTETKSCTWRAHPGTPCSDSAMTLEMIGVMAKSTARNQ